MSVYKLQNEENNFEHSLSIEYVNLNMDTK